MPFSEKEMLEDLHKVRIRKYVYFLGGLGILGLTVALVVLFFARRDWPALLLAGVGAFWSVVLLYQARRTRELEALIKTRLAERPGGPAAGDRSKSPPGGLEPGGEEPVPPGSEEVTPEGGAPGEP